MINKTKLLQKEDSVIKKTTGHWFENFRTFSEFR